MRGCSFEGCGKPHDARGLCNGHWLQWRAGQPLRALRPRGAPNEWLPLPGNRVGIQLRDIHRGDAGVAIVDAVDFERVRKLHWFAHGGLRGCTTYVMTDLPRRKGAPKVSIFLHRMILQLEDSPEVLVDFIDGNGLNCARANIRLATQRLDAQNAVRSARPPHMRGVSFHQASGLYRARVHLRGVEHCSYHATPDQAAEAARSARARLLPFANEERHRAPNPGAMP